MSRGLPLDGVAVLDFCWIGAGALVTKTLSELGAVVYRVESMQRPDNLRLAPPFRPGTEGLEASGYFASRNPNKKSVAINMAEERGRDIARLLVEKVDIVTSNFRPGVMERWGLTHADLARINPGIISMRMPMQGSEGPHASYIGFGSTIAALSGLVHLSGVPGRTPVGTGTHYPDHVPNPGHALVALLAALRHQRRTGQGQEVELSQFESTVNVVGPAIVQASLGGTPVASGNRSPEAAPRAAFRTADDRWLVVACYTDDQWSYLVQVLGLPDTVRNRFATSVDRHERLDELEGIVAEAVAAWLADDLLAALDGSGVPSGAVNTSRDIFEDARLDARGFWETVEHPVLEEMPISRMPFRIRGVDPAPIERPPLLGEHTFEVLSELLEMDQGQHDALVADGVLT